LFPDCTRFVITTDANSLAVGPLIELSSWGTDGKTRSAFALLSGATFSSKQHQSWRGGGKHADPLLRSVTECHPTEDMDVDAGRILEGRATLNEVRREIFDRVLAVAAGSPSVSERLGHQEFILTYKTFAPIGPARLP
jgi:hypothetical protein